MMSHIRLHNRTVETSSATWYLLSVFLIYDFNLLKGTFVDVQLQDTVAKWDTWQDPVQILCNEHAGHATCEITKQNKRKTS